MSLTDKIHIGWSNNVENSTLTSTPTAETLHPLTNLTNGIRGKPTRWDFTTATDLVLKTNSATTQKATALIIKCHNLAEDATVRLRLYSGENQTGTVVYDSDSVAGASAIYTIKPWGEMIAGIDPWGNYYDPNSKLDLVYSLYFDTVGYKSSQIDIAVPSPVGDIVSIDTVALFFAYTPFINYSYGAKTSVVDKSVHNEDRGGGIRTNVYPSRRMMEFQFSHITETERNILTSIFEQIGKAANVYIIANPNFAGYSKFLTTSVYKRDNNLSFENMFWNADNLAFIFREN